MKKQVSRVRLSDWSSEVDSEEENTGEGGAGRGQGQSSGCSFATVERIA